MIALIDYGIGNLRSLERAFEAAGAPVIRTGDAETIVQAERIVLPGVGAFGACAEALRSTGLDRLVLDLVREGRPLLGVCVGMQLLFESSNEQGLHSGLGLLPGHVTRLTDRAADGSRLKVPHVGWNPIHPRQPHPLVAQESPHVYFVHSYAAAPAVESDILATATYGGQAVVAAVARGPIAGVQFHPEKSQRAGLALFARFAAWAPAPVAV